MSKFKWRLGDVCKLHDVLHFDDIVQIISMDNMPDIKVRVIRSWHNLKPGDELEVYKYYLKPISNENRPRSKK